MFHMLNQFNPNFPQQFGTNQFGGNQFGTGPFGFNPFSTPWGFGGNWQQQPWQTQNWNGQNWLGQNWLGQNLTGQGGLNTMNYGFATQGTTPNITAQGLTQMLINLSTQTQMQLQLQQFALQQALTLVQQIASQNLTTQNQTTQNQTGLNTQTTQGNYNQFVQGQLQQNPNQLTTNSNAGYGLGWGMFPGSTVPGMQGNYQQQHGGFTPAGFPNNLGNTNQFGQQQFGQQFGTQQGQYINQPGFTQPGLTQSGFTQNGFAQNTGQGINQTSLQNTIQATQGFTNGGNSQGMNGINQAYGPAVFGQGNIPWQQAGQAFPTQNVTPVQSLTTTPGGEMVEPASHKRLSRQPTTAGA